MAAILDADVSIDASGNIRWTGAATTNRHTILEFIQFLQDKQDDEQAAGDDLLDITVDTPFDRSTDQIVTLNAPFNIDDTFAKHLYDGSVSQTDPDDGGETLYSGLRLIGPVVAGTEYMIVQGNKVLPSFWGTGINPEAAPSLVFSRHLVKSKHAGAAIDGQRITVLARELGDQYRRFPTTLGTGNAVAAIGNGTDIFNTTADATIAGWDSIVNTEGFQELNLDGTGAAGQEFYSRWDIGSRSINDTYERTKWISQRSHITSDTGVQSGTNYIIDNATITGQGQSFTSSADSELLTEAVFHIREGAGTPLGTVYVELYAESAGVPNGPALARSAPLLASEFTDTYERTIFRFDRRNPADGTDQRAGLTLAPSTVYFLVLRNDEGTATDYFEVHGDATGTGVGAKAEDNGGFTAQAAEDLDMVAKTSPEIHGIAGEIFQGINVEVGYTGETGTGVAENDIVMWGTLITYDTLVSGPFFPGERVSIGSTFGTVLYDDLVDELIVALDAPAAAVIADNDAISSLRGTGTEATAQIAVTIVDEDLSGGEGLVLAKDDNGTSGELYIQTLFGANPVNTNRIRRDDLTGDPLADYVDATATINTRTVNPEYLGTSTGSNIIGAYGIGFDPSDVTASDLFTSLDNTSRTPPNNQTFTVSGLVAGEDRVLVGPRTGSNLERGQYLLDTTLSGGAEVSVVVADGAEDGTPIATDIPQDGSSTNTRLRIELDDGIYRRQAYTSHVGSTFTIPSSDYSVTNATSGNNVFVAFIDVLADATTESYTAQFVANRDLFVRVRDGGTAGDGIPIKTFESTAAQFLGTPQTVAAIRTADS